MSSSGALKLLWCIGHTFEFQACGSPATSAFKEAQGRLSGSPISAFCRATYKTFVAMNFHGRGFAELGVVPQVRLERL